jgi:hypothetical protein
MADPYGAETQWFKVLNRTYSQMLGRAELFQKSTHRPSNDRSISQG